MFEIEEAVQGGYIIQYLHSDAAQNRGWSQIKRIVKEGDTRCFPPFSQPFTRRIAICVS
jgi:hypothetical protein